MTLSIERRVARVFSTAKFRPILRGEGSAPLDLDIRQLRQELGLHGRTSNGEVVAAAYRLIAESYRSEYFYKNLIANKIVVGRHKASNVVLLTEFRVGNSIADCVVLNGSAAVYEVKTEFDSPEKLARQLSNYFLAFSLVNVVANEGNAQKYLDVLQGSPAGLLVVGTRSRLSVIKAATPHDLDLDVTTMFNALRDSDTEAILTETFGPLPPAPNGLRYMERLTLAKRMSPLQFQASMQAALKRRIPRGDKQLLTDPTMLPLRAILLQLNPTRAQGENLLRWLDHEEDLDVLPVLEGQAV